MRKKAVFPRKAGLLCPRIADFRASPWGADLFSGKSGEGYLRIKRATAVAFIRLNLVSGLKETRLVKKAPNPRVKVSASVYKLLLAVFRVFGFQITPKCVKPIPVN